MLRIAITIIDCHSRVDVAPKCFRDRHANPVRAYHVSKQRETSTVTFKPSPPPDVAAGSVRLFRRHTLFPCASLATRF